MSNPILQVYILSYERPDTILESIESVLSQSFDSFEVIVSDNSKSNIVHNTIQEKYPYVKIKRRIPSVSVFDHINVIMSEVSSDYFMMFHDDDILLPHALKNLMGGFEHDITAISGNGLILQHEKVLSNSFNTELGSDLIIRDKRQLAERYIDGYRFINPFPGYIYRKKIADRIKFGTKDIGKYSDVAFLLDILEIGPILWLSKECMIYRIHETNDSQTIDLKAMKNLCSYMLQESGIEKTRVDEFYNYTALVSAIRNKKLISFVKHFSFFALHPVLLTTRVYNRFAKS